MKKLTASLLTVTMLSLSVNSFANTSVAEIMNTYSNNLTKTTKAEATKLAAEAIVSSNATQADLESFVVEEFGPKKLKDIRDAIQLSNGSLETAVELALTGSQGSEFRGGLCATDGFLEVGLGTIGVVTGLLYFFHRNFVKNTIPKLTAERNAKLDQENTDLLNQIQALKDAGVSPSNVLITSKVEEIAQNEKYKQSEYDFGDGMTVEGSQKKMKIYGPVAIASLGGALALKLGCEK